MSSPDATKRIPKAIGTEAQLFGTYTLTDLAVGLFPGVAVLLLMQVVVPSSATVAGYALQSLTLPLAAVAIGVGATFVYLTPPYTSSLDWLATFGGFSRREKTHDFAAGKELTRIERIHPAEGFLERTDGALLGMVQVTPPTMALATDDQWRSTATAFQNFLNTTVEYPIQIFSTTQAFPTEDYVAQYEARLTDPDVLANPQLQTLIEEYVKWYTAEMEQRKMTIRDHYIVIPVTPAEVQFERESVANKLARLPVVGLLVQAWFAPRVEEEFEAMQAELAERLRRIEMGIREIEGCSADRVDVDEMTTQLASFWSGGSRGDEEMAERIRTTPLVRRPQ
jgi:hypothetical protein